MENYKEDRAVLRLILFISSSRAQENIERNPQPPNKTNEGAFTYLGRRVVWEAVEVEAEGVEGVGAGTGRCVGSCQSP